MANDSKAARTPYEKPIVATYTEEELIESIDALGMPTVPTGS